MKVLISILFFMLANTGFADDMRYYDVEIVIFQNLDAKAKDSENWPLEVNLTQEEKTVQLGQPVLSEWLPPEVDLKESYKLLKADSYHLTKEVEKISESTTRRVIFHTAWRQPGLNKEQALPIHFKREIPAAPIIENDSRDNKNIDENSYNEDDNKINSTPSILEGILRVTLARYLHLETELTFRNKIPLTTASDNPFSILDNENERNQANKQGVIYLKQERRRIRSNELHYLDHPVMGILVYITQYKKPDES